jgi:hypothetical protein
MGPVSALDIRLPDICQDELMRLFFEMETNGFACVPRFLMDADLAMAQKFVATSMHRSGNEYIAYRGSEAVRGSGLDDLATSLRFQSIFARLYEASRQRPAPPVEFYQLLRCLAGTGMLKHSFNFHYDSYLITALVPIVIPDTGKPGDLYLAPITRPVRRSYIANVIDKIILEKFKQKALRRRAEVDPQWFTRIRMVPGNLYLFWGYRTVHANEPCDPGTVRATALYHFFDPHSGSSLKHRLRWLGS